MKNLILKIFGAEYWHDDVIIVGSKQSLMKLRDSIDTAIKNQCDVQQFVEADGEGYYVHILRQERTREQWQKLPLHYTDEMADNNSENQQDELQRIMREEPITNNQ
jgi:hypothetical protein